MTETRSPVEDETVAFRRRSSDSITYRYLVGILLTILIGLVGAMGGALIADQKALQAAIREERDARLRREGLDDTTRLQRAADLQKIEDLRIEMSKLAELVDQHQRWLAATFGQIPDRSKYSRRFD